MIKDGVHWLSLLELESSRGDWVRSRKSTLSIDNIYNQLQTDRDVVNITLTVDRGQEYYTALRKNGAWCFAAGYTNPNAFDILKKSVINVMV